LEIQMKLIQQVGALVVFLVSTFAVLAYSDEITVEFEKGTAVVNLRTLRVVPLPDGDTAYGANAVLLWKDGRKLAVTVYITGRAGCGRKPHILYLTEYGNDEVAVAVVAQPGSPDERVAEAICGAVGKAKETADQNRAV
jgi:hypothetical protein